MDIYQLYLEPTNPDEEEGLYLLKCLCLSLNDEEGKTLVKRHIILMTQYLHQRKNGIVNKFFSLIGEEKKFVAKTFDLPYLTSPIEFFCENSIDEPLYAMLILKCLNLLLKPILFHKSSDACSAVENLEHFFSSLGNCLHVTEADEVESALLDVILFMITYKEKKSVEVSLEIRLEAVENSFLPEIMVSFMFFITDELYQPLLEIMYQLSFQPPLANLFQSLGCMDYWLRKVAIKSTLSIREAATKETTSNLLWSIMRSPDTFGDEPTLNSESLSILRGWLRREVLFGQTYERNNIAALLLQTLLSIPKLETSRSGILEDVGMLAFATEFGTDGTWANKITFKPTRDDLDFKKILITILLIMNEDPTTKMVLEKNRAMNALAWILNLKNTGILKWNQNHKLELINCCLYALPILSKYFKQEYTWSGVTTRILDIIEFSVNVQQNLRLVKNCCLCLHLLISSGISQEHFKEANVTLVLINTIIYSLHHLKLNLQVQTIITYCFCAITNLVQNDANCKVGLGFELYELYTETFKRLQKPALTDAKISNSLLIAACDFAWQCIVLNESTKDAFFEDLGVYSIFNVMEDAPFLVQLLFLSVASDLIVDPKSLPQIVTWRGKNNDNNFFKIMCGLWRTQEKIKGVPRDENGCIEDIEKSLMGEKQLKVLKSENDDISGSPSLVDLIGCARPKIAIAIDLILRRHYEKVTLARSVYNLPFDAAMSPEDKITLQIILCFEELKKAEILEELQRAVDKAGVKLLPLDVEILHKLVMRLIGLANKVQKNQRAILKTMKKKELDEENKVYKDIQEYKLATAVKELAAKDYYLTVSNKFFRKWKHDMYQDFLDQTEQLYADRMEKNFHQTFNHPRNFIVVKTGRDAHIRSIKKKKEQNRISFYEEDVLDETCEQHFCC